MALREHRLLAFRKAFSRNTSLDRALRARGFGMDRADANELVELFELDSFCGKVCAQAMLLGKASPQQALIQITAAMVELQSVALRVEPIHALSAIEREAERQFETHQLMPSPEALSKEVTGWQHITGRTSEALQASSATMHEVSRGLVHHWAHKIVAHLWPHRELLPVWIALGKSSQPLVHFTDIFRNSRRTTLRRRTLGWIRYAKDVVPPLPFDEGRIADWLESIRSTLTKSSLKAIRSVFSFFCGKTGLPNICLGGIVTNKIKAILEETTTVRFMRTRKAATIPVRGIAYLEEVATSPDNECDGILAYWHLASDSQQGHLRGLMTPSTLG